MSVEIPRVTRESVRGVVAVTVVLAATSTGILVVAREVSRRREGKLFESEALAQSAGDGNYVTTLEEVKLRLG